MASPTPSLDSLNRGCEGSSEGQEGPPFNGSESSDSSSSKTTSPVSFTSCEVSDRCELCHDSALDPKVLSCSHMFCERCYSYLDLSYESNCPKCAHFTSLSVLSGRAASAFMESLGENNLCKHEDGATQAVAWCCNCEAYLCSTCVVSHQNFSLSFGQHKVIHFSTVPVKYDKTGNVLPSDKTIPGHTFCPKHKNMPLKLFCRSCFVLICKECTAIDHPVDLHPIENLSDILSRQLQGLARSIQDSKSKASQMETIAKTLEYSSRSLNQQYERAQNEINRTCDFFKSLLDDRKSELLKELESVFSASKLSIHNNCQKAQESADSINKVCDFFENSTRHFSVPECLMFRNLINMKLKENVPLKVEALSGYDLEFVSNYPSIQVGIKNTFGYIKSATKDIVNSSPPSSLLPINDSLTLPSKLVNLKSCEQTFGSLSSYLNTLSVASLSELVNIDAIDTGFTASKDFNSNGISLYDRWSDGTCDLSRADSLDHQPAVKPHLNTDCLSQFASKVLSTSMSPFRSPIERQKMLYHCKFGEWGTMEGQFTEPSGVAVNAQNGIIVADTNNHRIQVFDKEGRFKFQFGECGKQIGQLLYPNRVAVVKKSGDIIIAERSPTHQIQIYNQYGQFSKKFGDSVLQHPRGVAVDSNGYIIVVECKVMRVVIFNQEGDIMHKFGCSKHLAFPNGIVVNDNQEIFISDNRKHCVKVFSYEGAYLRQIGGEGITNYPIGVGINSLGQILIADNHNNFNLTIFSQEGQLVSAFESKVKHAQCFDIAVMYDGSIVLASKDYKVYLYRYMKYSSSG